MPRSVASGLLAVLVAGCGGGGDAGVQDLASAPMTAAEAPAAAAAALRGVSRLIVAGDSLADVGTFGFKFTVQDAADPRGFPVFPELVAAEYALPGGCSHYMDSGSGGVIARGDQSCTNFAVGGARILHRGDGPRSVPTQLREAAIKVGSRYNPDDLVLIDGGANDAAEVAAGYLAATVSRTGMFAFIGFLAREVDVDDLLSTAPGDDSLGRSAALYMEKAADTLVETIVNEVLARGAVRIAVLNVPDITRTPRFAAAFDQLVQRYGAETSASIQAAVRQAVGAYNARLQLRLGHDPRIVLVDVRSTVDDHIARAAELGLANAVQAACPVTGTGSAGLPEWSLPTCTSAALDAAAAGGVPGWWSTWVFSDGFHPSPMGHRLLARTVSDALRAAAWP